MKVMLILLLTINTYAFESGWVREPIDCNKLSDNVVTECKYSVLKSGEFEYYKAETIDECRRVRDSALSWKCAEAFSKGGIFALSKKDHDFATIKKDVEFERRSAAITAKATQDIAFYLKIQTVILCIGVGAGLLITLIN